MILKQPRFLLKPWLFFSAFHRQNVVHALRRAHIIPTWREIPLRHLLVVELFIDEKAAVGQHFLYLGGGVFRLHALPRRARELFVPARLA